MSKWVYRSLVSGLFLGAVLTSCSGKPTATEVSTSPQPQAETTEVSEATTSSSKIVDRGDIKVSYADTQNPDYQEIRQILEQIQTFEQIAEAYNQELALPTDIQVVFEECNEVNAYYIADESKISMCYELIQHYKDIFAAQGQSKEEYQRTIVHAALFTFYHELGHALVDKLKLPITGKEEDAVDEFAAIVLLNTDDEGQEAALAGVAQFGVDAEASASESKSLDELAFWDEHSLDQQRFYSMACLVYGSDPNKFSYLMEDGTLPSERAENCPAEYQQKVNSWNTLLDPFYK